MKKVIDFFKVSNFIFYFTIFIFILSLALIHNTIDMDYWARLLQGNAFWAFGDILRFDPFSYTKTHIWLDHEWGSSVIFAFIQNNFGFKGILIFRALVVFLIFFFIFKTLKINNSNYLFNIIYFPLMIVFAIPTIVESGLRCHFFTFLFFTIFIYILEHAKNSKKYKMLYFLPVLMLFWSNVHGGCVAGLGLLGMYAVGEFLNKNSFKHYLIVLMLAFFALFVNPYGIEYVKFIFMASIMERPFVTEWISPFAHPNIKFFLAYKIIYILNIIFVFAAFKMKYLKDWTKIIILAVCAYLSFKYIKNTPFFIFASIIFLYPFLNNLFKRYENKKIACIINTMIILFSIWTISKYPMKPILTQQPVQIAEFMKINNLQGNIFSPFDIGSYLIYKLFPNNLVYMDGRYEEVYFDETKKLADDFFKAGQNWDNVLKIKPEPDYIIIPSLALVDDYLAQNSEYTLIFSDSINNIYAKTSKLKEKYYLPVNDADYYNNQAFETNFSVENLKNKLSEKISR